MNSIFSKIIIKIGFLKAQIDFALDRPDLHDAMIEILRGIDLHSA